MRLLLKKYQLLMLKIKLKLNKGLQRRFDGSRYQNIILNYRKRLNSRPSFFHTCTSFMYEVHA